MTTTLDFDINAMYDTYSHICELEDLPDYKKRELGKIYLQHVAKESGKVAARKFKEFMYMTVAATSYKNWNKDKYKAVLNKVVPQTLKEKIQTKARAAYKAKMKKLQLTLLNMIAPTEDPLEYLEILQMNGVGEQEEAQVYLSKHKSYFLKESAQMTNAEAKAFEGLYEAAQKDILSRFDSTGGEIKELLDMTQKEVDATYDEADFDMVDEYVKTQQEYAVSQHSNDLKIMLSKGFSDAEFAALDQRFSNMTIDIIREGSNFRNEEHSDVFFGKEGEDYFVRLSTHSLGDSAVKGQYSVPSIAEALEEFTSVDLLSYTVEQVAMGGTWYAGQIGSKVFATVDAYDRLVTPVTKKVLWHIDIKETEDPFVDTMILKTRYVDVATGNKVKKMRPKPNAAKKLERHEALSDSLTGWLDNASKDHPLYNNVKEMNAAVEAATDKVSYANKAKTKMAMRAAVDEKADAWYVDYTS